MAPPLEIKLPVPLERRREDVALPSAIQVKLKQQNEERYSSPSATPIGINNDDMEEDEEDEDDWDAFQSFPATKNAAETDSVVENTVKELDHDESISYALEISTDNSQQYSEVATEILSDCSGDGGNREKSSSDVEVEEVNELSTKIAEHMQRRASTETGHNEDAEGSIDVVGDDEQQKESSDNKVDTDLVSDTQPHVRLSDTETKEEAEHNMDQEQH